MKLTLYPKNVLVAAALLAALGVALDLAIDARHGAAAGVAALLVYLGLDAALTVNPGQWWRRRRLGA